MATSNGAYLPSQTAVDAVVAQVVRPHVESLAKEGFPGLQASLHIYVQGECVASRKLAIPGTTNELVPAELRSEFRRTIDPHRSLFMVQAMLEQPIIRPALGLKTSPHQDDGDAQDQDIKLSEEHPEADMRHIVWGILRRGLQPVPPKASIALRLDADVLSWFKAQGPGYQTRINAVLRACKDASL